jgi:hypothetical protein
LCLQEDVINDAVKRETLRMFSDATIILAVPAASADSYGDLGVPIIVYKSGIKLEPVMETLKAVVMGNASGAKPAI